MLKVITILLLLLIAIQYSGVFKAKGIASYWFSAAFLVKFGAGISLWYIYTFIYTDRASADIFKYFDDAKHLFEATKNNLPLRWELLATDSAKNESVLQLLQGTQHWSRSESYTVNDNPVMIRIHLLLFHLSKGNFHVHTLFFSFFSFIGSFGLFQFFKQESNLNHKLIFIAAFISPSLLFWTSAPLKESYLLFVLGIFLFSVSNLLKKASLLNACLLVIGFIGLLTIKNYILIALFMGIVFFLLSRRVSSKQWIKLFLSIHVLGAAVFYFYGTTAISMLSEKQISFKKLIVDVGANSEIYLPSFHDFWTLLFAIPVGIYNVFIHPLIPNHFTSFSALASVEHLFYVALLLLPLLYYRAPSSKEKRLALFCFSFLFISASIIGLTTPVLGAIVRYKTPLIPFYLILLFIFVDFNKLLKAFSK